MSLHISKLFKSSLALASAVLVIHVGAAAAADSMGDTQQQMKELLTGATTAPATPQSGARDGNVTARSADVQEWVKQLLLGATVSGREGAEVIKHSEVAAAWEATGSGQRATTYGDSQAAVRQVLLGQQHASDAAFLASRSTR